MSYDWNLCWHWHLDWVSALVVDGVADLFADGVVDSVGEHCHRLATCSRPTYSHQRHGRYHSPRKVQSVVHTSHTTASKALVALAGHS